MLFMNLFLWFLIYSFVGWAWETLQFTILEKRFVNRGFLNGPLCPVYGIGALLLLWALSGRAGNVPVLFLCALVLTTSLEYLTAVLLEKLFHAKWWDYSSYPLNLKGRISLLSSLFFAVASVFFIRYLHPFVMSLTGRLPIDTMRILTAVFAVYIAIDLTVTVRHILILNGRLSEIQTAINGFFGKYAQRAGDLKNAILVNFEDSEFYSERIRTLFSLDRFQNRRIFKAFPKLRSIKYDDALKKLRARIIGSRDDDNE